MRIIEDHPDPITAVVLMMRGLRHRPGPLRTYGRVEMFQCTVCGASVVHAAGRLYIAEDADQKCLGPTANRIAEWVPPLRRPLPEKEEAAP